jgi:phosphoribosylglycinamide formyltransferase-1
MAPKITRFAFVTSTAGSVMNRLLTNDFLKYHVHSVVADRKCDALEKASAHAVPAHLFQEQSPNSFFEQLAQHIEENDIDYILSFYTNFYSKKFRDRFRDRIINSHPSLLPAFKGMTGFEDGVDYHCKIVGSTIEFIRDVMDEGAIIAQAACPVDLNQDLSVTRHRVFVQQCKTMLQTVKWIVDDRLRVNGAQVLIEGAKFSSLEYSPALDFDQAIDWNIPMPENISWPR